MINKNLRTAREGALQVLFQREFQTHANPQQLYSSFIDNFIFDDGTKEYILYLTHQILANEEKINETIQSKSENWAFDRIALMDRILLQIGVFELKYSEQTPTDPKLTITDIIDLSKKYSTEESKNFINGILDQVYQDESSANE